MHQKHLLIFVILMSFLFISAGCQRVSNIPSSNKVSKAKELCIQKCLQIKAEQDLNSECLDNEILTGWVCDVAHLPRQQVDNLPENQCSAYRRGQAKHFIEVTPECEFIRGY